MLGLVLLSLLEIHMLNFTNKITYLTIPEQRTFTNIKAEFSDCQFKCAVYYI